MDGSDTRADIDAGRREDAAEDAAHERGWEHLVDLPAVEHDDERGGGEGERSRVPDHGVRGEPRGGGGEMTGGGPTAVAPTIAGTWLKNTIHVAAHTNPCRMETGSDVMMFPSLARPHATRVTPA